MSGKVKRRRFEVYQGRLFGYALSLGTDHHLAEELVQDCIVRALAARRVPREEAAYRAWLFTIVRNLWRDHARRAQRRDKFRLAEATAPDPAPGSVETAIVNTIAVRHAFEHLSEDHREVLALVDVGGFTYNDAAAVLEIPAGTVMSRVSRARTALARLLSDTNLVGYPATGKRARP